MSVPTLEPETVETEAICNMSSNAQGSAEAFLVQAALTYRAPAADIGAGGGAVRCGIDLGTDTVVLTLVESGPGQVRPVYYDSRKCEAVRDGVVVDFAGAVAATRELLRTAREVTGLPIDRGAAAYPPGVPVADARACRFVLEQAGIDCSALVDEVSAAQALLAVRDGVVVDVGGGSTGVGSYLDGELVRLGDLPGGGHHLDLILAGALQLSLAEAEAAKRADSASYLQILKPGIEKIASNIRALMSPDVAGPIHLTGGAIMVRGADRVIANHLDRPVVLPPNALLATPFGIALSSPDPAT